MSWEYQGPSASPKDEVRFLIGDTDVEDQLLSDEEIQYLVDTWLTVHGTVFYVASIACETIAAKLAREISYSADGVSVSLSELQEKFERQAETLRTQHKELFVGGAPDVGGISAYEEQDIGIAPLIFGTGMHDERSAGRQDYGNRQGPDFYPEDFPGQ
jgi:hypothetical protein